MKLPFIKSRPAYTLLYITEAKTFRIDTDKHGVIVGHLTVIDQRCDSDKNLPHSLEKILEKSEPLGKKLWISYVRLSTQLLSLPSAQLAGAEAEMLEQALLFEYESMTGESVAQSHLAHHFISDEDEMSSYWVTVLGKEIFTKITEALKPSGSKLQGVIHPAGLPELIVGEVEEDWLRLEIWSNTAITLYQKPSEALAMQIFHTEENSNWQEELNVWLLEIGEVERSETILNNRMEYLPHTDDTFHLSDEVMLELCLGRWVSYLLSVDKPAIPVINKERHINMDLVLMLGGGGLALVLCVGHFTWNLYQRNEFEYQVEQLTKAEKDIKSARDGGKKTRESSAKIEKTLATLRTNVQVIPKAMAALQSRPMLLLKGLAESSPKDLIIESISVNEEAHIMVKGVALQPHLINQLASQAKSDFTDLGWSITTPTKTDLMAFPAGGPWEFSFLLKDNGLGGFSK